MCDGGVNLPLFLDEMTTAALCIASVALVAVVEANYQYPYFFLKVPVDKDPIVCIPEFQWPPSLAMALYDVSQQGPRCRGISHTDCAPARSPPTDCV